MQFSAHPILSQGNLFAFKVLNQKTKTRWRRENVNLSRRFKFIRNVLLQQPQMLPKHNYVFYEFVLSARSVTKFLRRSFRTDDFRFGFEEDELFDCNPSWNTFGMFCLVILKILHHFVLHQIQALHLVYLRNLWVGHKLADCFDDVFMTFVCMPTSASYQVFVSCLYCQERIWFKSSGNRRLINTPLKFMTHKTSSMIACECCFSLAGLSSRFEWIY